MSTLELSAQPAAFTTMTRKIFNLFTLLLAGLLVQAQQLDYPYTAVPFTSVKLNDQFWLPRIKTNQTITIPASFERCDKTGRIKNFVMAAEKKGNFCTTYTFDDTDIYKTIEGASFSLSLFPDKKLELYVDSLITIVGRAQEPDGYLYTARTIDPLHPPGWAGKERWVKERELSHELYNSGHLYEAAAAHFQATGKRNLLDIALKNADLICSVFGPDKMHTAPGHEVVEMGLVKLYRITGKKAYLDLAKFFIEERGHYKGYDVKNKDPWKNGAYWQDHIPVADQREAVGHAVRAGYLYSAVADVAALTGDKALLKAIDSIWVNLVTKKIYVQGGAGAVGSGERYGDNYELPNATAYNETCAAIANVYWNQRMFQLHGESKYVDLLEKILYNGLLSGVGLDGKSFFYTNALQIRHNFKHPDMEAERSGWFECSCCPTNICRLLPSVPGYMYAQHGNAIYVNLFAASTMQLKLGKQNFQIEQQNNYPWDGALKFIIGTKTKQAVDLRIRIPGWAKQEAIASSLYWFGQQQNQPVELKINGQAYAYTMDKGYAILNREWKNGDVVELNLPMPVQRVYCNDKVTDNRGLVSLQRGPLTYCAEWTDNNQRTSNLVLPANAVLMPEYNAQLLNGVTVLKGEAVAIQPAADNLGVNSKKQAFVAIPYYAWANRGKGEMNVWFPETIKNISIIAY